MTRAELFIAVLAVAFIAGIAGAVIDTAAWLVLCAPFVAFALFAGAFIYAANRFFEGLRLW